MDKNKYISGQEQKDFIDYFDFPKYSADMWAAKYGHLIGCGDLRNFTFDNIEFQKWVHELFQILQDNDLATLRKKLLTVDEQNKIDIAIKSGF
jgi:hypothetical protein